MKKDKEKISIVLITEYFPPEIGAGSNRAYELARHWVNLGGNVTVLTGFPDYPDGIRPENYRGLNFLKEKKEGFDIIRTYTYSTPNIGFVRRVFSYISFLFSSVLQGTKAIGQQDIVVASSPPFFVGVSGYIISRLKRVPFIFEVRDLWPESIVQLGQIKNKFIIWILEKIELFLYQKAKLIVPVADSSVEVISSKGIDTKKIIVIKNGVNVDELVPLPIATELKVNLNLNEKFVVSYFGTLGLSHAIDIIVETANKAKLHNDIYFLIIGNGAEKKKLLKKVTDYNLPNIQFLDSVGRGELANYYSITDLQIVSLKKIDLFNKVIPSKIFEIMSHQKPILISVDGEARKIIEESKSGLFVEQENPDDLLDKILLLKNDPELRKEMARNGRKFVEEHFDRKKLASKYFTLLKNLIIN